LELAFAADPSGVTSRQVAGTAKLQYPKPCFTGCKVRPDEPGDLHLIICSEAVGMAYRKRAFLNPITTGKPSFVFAVAESSEGGKKAHGNYVLTIADCKRLVELEFPLSDPRLRKQSLAKIDLLAEVINRFNQTIHAEADLIGRRKR
jgi:hypothetical protein